MQQSWRMVNAIRLAFSQTTPDPAWYEAIAADPKQAALMKFAEDAQRDYEAAKQRRNFQG